MARLEEAHDEGGRRYYLDGRPIECGTRLEVSLKGGWLPVRFEMDLQQFPVFCLRLSEGRGLESQIEFRLPDMAELRWLPQQDPPEETGVRKLRRVVEDLAEIVQAPEEYSEDERGVTPIERTAGQVTSGQQCSGRRTRRAGHSPDWSAVGDGCTGAQ